MKSFGTLLDKTTKAVTINDRRIKRAVSQIVPAKTMAHIEFCRLEGGRLRITVDGAAWVSRVSFMEKHIIHVMRERQFDTHTISYHVSPKSVSESRKTVRRTINNDASGETAANALANDW